MNNLCHRALIGLKQLAALIFSRVNGYIPMLVGEEPASGGISIATDTSVHA